MHGLIHVLLVLIFEEVNILDDGLKFADVAGLLLGASLEVWLAVLARYLLQPRRVLLN